VQATSPSEIRLAHRYVALGDSFTAGAAGSDDAGFADHLADLLRAVNPSLDYRNLAKAGSLTSDIVARQLGPAVAAKPDVVTIVCGGNDALLSVRPDVHAHLAAFERALEIVGEQVPDAALVTATVPDPARFLPLRERSAARISNAINQINEATSAAAGRHGVPCLDFAAHPHTSNPEMYAADGYHPSRSASRLAAEAFAGVLGIHYGIQFDSEEVL